MTSCANSKASEPNSFCTQYRRVIVEKGDGTITAKLSVKQRLVGNDALFRCQCEGWKNPICESLK